MNEKILTYKSDCLERGLFSCFLSAFAVINFCNENNIKVFIDFKSKNLYSNNENENMWELYFKQPFSSINYNNDIKYEIGFYDNFFNNVTKTEELNIILNKCRKIYKENIIIQEEILKEFKEHSNKMNFVENSFLGCHIRGTDYFGQLPSCEFYFKNIDKNLETKKYNGLFVCTDEEEILEKLKRRYKNIYFLDIQRSKNHSSLHHENKHINGYRKGKDALLDALFLSKCKHIIVSNSNFSFFGLIFNDTISYEFIKNNYK